MKKTQPEAFTLDRIASPVGEVLLVNDAEGAVRAFDFVDYEARMRKLLARHYGEVVLTEGRAPEAVRAAVAAYFGGDATALDGIAVKTGGTDFQRSVWAALRTIPAGETSVLWPTRLGHRQAQRRARRGSGQRRQSGRRHRALPPRRRRQRNPDRLRRRAGAQALAARARGRRVPPYLIGEVN